MNTSKLRNDVVTRKYCTELAIQTGVKSLSGIFRTATILEYFFINGVSDIASFNSFVEDVNTHFTNLHALEQ